MGDPGREGLRRNTEGQGEIVSAFQEGPRVSVPLTESKLAKINAFRERVGRPALKTSPGLRFCRKARTGRVFGVQGAIALVYVPVCCFCCIGHGFIVLPARRVAGGKRGGVF